MAAAVKRVRPFPFDRVARLARAQVEAGRALLAHLPLAPGTAWAEAEAALAGRVAIELEEAFAFPAHELAARAAGVLVLLSAPAGRSALIAIDPRLAPHLARRALGVPSEPQEIGAARPLTPAEQGALAFLAAALVDGSPVRVEAVLDGEDAARRALDRLSGEPWLYALEAHLRTPAGDGWARLIASERLRVQAPLPRSIFAALARRERLAEARVSLRIEVGRTRLDRADFAGLAVRDVVLFDDFGPRPPFGGPVALRLGRGGFAANLAGDGLTILSMFRLGAPTMDQPNDPPPDGGAPPPPEERPAGASAEKEAAATDALLRELPVEVVCELGRVTMSGRELLELRPGAVVPVGRPLAGPVDLTVGGRVVARGELVDIEGEIGVRVTQINE